MNPKIPQRLPMSEFIPLMALMISLIALSIDAMLPALPDIGRDLLVQSENDQQLVAILWNLQLADA